MCSFLSELGPPVFIIGAPRSGTTYVAELMNKHSQVFITNELRVMTFLNRVLNRVASNKWVLMNGRKEFLKSFESELPSMVERHYLRLGAPPGVRWGDKNPHYADAKTDPECLDLINRLFPEAQFINIVRNGRDVVASLLRKQWVEFDEAVDVWRRHVEHAAEFGERIGKERFLQIRFEELVADDAAAASRMCDFLGLEAESEMLDFAAAQAVARTPFSKPTSDLATVGQLSSGPHFEREMEEVLVARIGDMLERYGYM